LLWGALGGLGSGSGALALYYGMTVGRMSVVATLSGLLAAVIPVFVGLVGGDSISTASAIGIVIAFVTIVGGAFLTEDVAGRVGLGGAAWGAISLLRWPVVFAILLAAAAIMYRIGPNLQPSWRSALSGAAVFAVGWLVATFAFAQYVTRFADYGATYGALGGVIVLMIWLYVTGLILLVGAEVVAILVGRTEPGRLEARRAETAVVDVVDGVRQTARQTLGRAAQVTGSDADGSRTGQGSTHDV
jgi:membrane protein